MSYLAKFPPALRTAIGEAARKAFAYNPVDPTRTGNRVLKTKPIGPLVANHYADTKVTEGFFRMMSPSFRTEQEERRAAKLLRLRRRGKSPPKKGEGKRKSKK